MKIKLFSLLLYFYSSCQRKAISSVILCAKARCNLHRLQKHTFRNIAILVVEFRDTQLGKLLPKSWTSRASGRKTMHARFRTEAFG